MLHLGGVAEDDIPENTLEIWARSFNPLYVILSIPDQMSSIFKIHRDQGTVHLHINHFSQLSQYNPRDI